MHVGCFATFTLACSASTAFLIYNKQHLEIRLQIHYIDFILSMSYIDSAELRYLMSPLPDPGYKVHLNMLETHSPIVLANYI